MPSVSRRRELRGETIPAAFRHDVMMIRGRRAAGEHHFRQRERSAEVQVFRREWLPEPVHVREPRQQRQIVPRRVGTRHRLIEMMVRVDEAGDGDAAARVVDRCLRHAGRFAGAHRGDHAAACQKPRIGKNLARLVHGYEEADVANEQIAGRRVSHARKMLEPARKTFRCSHGAPSPCPVQSIHGDGAPWLQPERQRFGLALSQL